MAARQETKASGRSTRGAAAPRRRPPTSSTRRSTSRCGSRPWSSAGTALSRTSLPPKPSIAKPRRSERPPPIPPRRRPGPEPSSRRCGNRSSWGGSGPRASAPEALEEDALVGDVLVDEEHLLLGGRHHEGVVELPDHRAEAGRPEGRRAPRETARLAGAPPAAPATLRPAPRAAALAASTPAPAGGPSGAWRPARAGPPAPPCRPPLARAAATGSAPTPSSDARSRRPRAAARRCEARPTGKRSRDRSGRYASSSAWVRSVSRTGRPFTTSVMSSRPPRSSAGGEARPDTRIPCAWPSTSSIRPASSKPSRAPTRSRRVARARRGEDGPPVVRGSRCTPGRRGRAGSGCGARPPARRGRRGGT